jgi:SAM-dependent methyltransferase
MVTVTNDGCAVEVYSRLPPRGEPELIHSVAPEQGSVLDLGAGVGRIADPLVALGHRVVAVDDSPDMLARVTAAECVCSRIEELRLDERFDVVVLASHLLNTADAPTRRALLETVAHHLAPGGRAVLEWHPPEWFDRLRPGETTSGELGTMAVALTVHSLDADVLSATVEYRAADLTASQTFRARRLPVAQLRQELRAVGLVHAEAVPATTDWLVARRGEDRSALSP